MDKEMWIALLRTSLAITLIPVSFGLIQVFLFDDTARFYLYNTWWQWLLFNAGITFLLTLSASSISTYIGRRLPYEKTHYAIRITVILLSVTVAAALIMLGYHKAWCPFILLDCGSRERLFTNITLAVVISIVITVISEGMCLFELWKKSLLSASELREENLKSQLEVLKSQINPHFLFNTLNSIYVQSSKDVEMARENILQFSELLSYQLYDSRQEWVALSGELEYLRNYIALEKLRQGDAVALQLDMVCPSGNVKVAPLLFTPLVENAFKYGLASGLKQYQLSMSLHFQEGQLCFTCKNSYRSVPKNTRGGLGLANLRKRLELIYPDKHLLAISDDGQTYTAILHIPITQ